MSDSKYQTGTLGENLVVAELSKKGFIATTLSGNAPKIDILAYKDNVAFPIQVKTNKIGSVSLNVTKFLDIKFDEKTETQIIQLDNGMNGKLEINIHLIWILVFLNKEIKNEPEFYICREGDIQDSVAHYYSEYLAKQKIPNKRPRSWDSPHHGLYPDQLDEKFKNNWDLLEEEVAILSNRNK